MYKIFRYIAIICVLMCNGTLLYSQCGVYVDTLNISHISCFGSQDGSASLLSSSTYLNYSWDNISNGQNYGSGVNVTSVNNLEVGFYVVTGTNPLGSCPNISYSDTFEITEPDNLHLNIATTNTSCVGSDGTAIVTILNAGSSGPSTNPSSYCYSGPGSSLYSNIELVALTGDNTTINNNTTGLCDSYEDYTVMSADLSPGNNYTINISLGDCSAFGVNSGGGIFIDWNIDGDFNDSLETVHIIAWAPPNTYSINFTVPNFAIPGATRMRIVSRYDNGSVGPCDVGMFGPIYQDPWFGATEDYSILVNGGVTIAYPLNFLWSNGATTDSIFGLTAGMYSVVVTDANGCAFYDTTSILDTVLTATIELIDTIKCYGDFAEIDVIAQGGGGLYQYDLEYLSTFGLWLPLSSQTTNDTATYPMLPGNPPNSVQPAQYRVTVTDITLGCVAQSTITLLEPSVLSTSASSTSTTNCNGSDGTVSVSASGGNGPYTYSWNDSSNSVTQTVTNLSVGTYIVTVTDANACSITDTAIVASSGGNLSASITQLIPILCYGFTAIVEVTTLCGSGWYVYELQYWDPMFGGLWLPFSTQTTYATATFTLIPPQNNVWRIVVTDQANSNTAIASFTVNEPLPLLLSTTSISASCANACDGTASVVATGGTPPYSYLWSNGGTSTSISNLCAGQYTLTVTDSNSCTSTATIMVTEPSVLSTSASSTSTTSCNSSDGTVSVSASGGTGPYTYSWNDSSNSVTQTVTNLSVGTYIVTVTDTNGCSITDTAIVTNGGNLIASVTQLNPILCYGGHATVEVTTLCGSGWYFYQLQYWDPMFGGLWLPFSTQTTYDTATFTQIPANNWRVVVTDQANSNTIITLVTINEPPPLLLSTTSISASCANACDGTASVVATGGTPPYSYLWSNGGTSTSISNLCSGQYILTVTDSNNCTSAATIMVTEPLQLSLTMSANQIICNGGTPSNLSASSGVSGSYIWSPSTSLSNVNDSIASFSTGLLSSQTYTVYFTDVNGCNATDSVSIVVNPLPVVSSLVATPSPACVGDDIQVQANTSIPVSRYRFQYDDGNGWQNMTSPVFSTSNPITFNNIQSVTQFRVKVREAVGCNISLWSPIVTVPIFNVATQPINHY